MDLTPEAQLDRLLAQLAPVGTETLPLDAAAGRVLAAPVAADRDNPAVDVSAMDGWAIQRGDLDVGARLRVGGESRAGHAPPRTVAGEAIRIATGAPFPEGAAAVVPVEDATEASGEVTLTALPPAHGYVRRRGENVRAGALLGRAGHPVTPPVAGMLSTFGGASLTVHRRVRVVVLTTGDEVRQTTDRPEPWQLRDSNGPTLRALLGRATWIELVRHDHAEDEPDAVREALRRALASADAVLMTGGVSRGAHDEVPGAAAACGCTTVFHRLPQRPGKPLFAAIGPAGQAVLGLPGNPVSVLVTARRFAVPALRKLAGFAEPVRKEPLLPVARCAEGLPGVWAFRLARRAGGGVELLEPKSSGDVVAAGDSDGFVIVPPGAPAGDTPRPFWAWEFD